MISKVLLTSLYTLRFHQSGDLSGVIEVINVVSSRSSLWCHQCEELEETLKNQDQL